MNLFERIGRLQVALDSESANHRKTIDILEQVANGNIDPSRLVFHEPGSYTLKPATTIEVCGTLKNEPDDNARPSPSSANVGTGD